MAFKNASKRAVQNTAEATGALIGNKVGNAVVKSYDGKITKILKTSQQNNSETSTNEHDKKYLKKDIYFQKKDRKLLMI